MPLFRKWILPLSACALSGLVMTVEVKAQMSAMPPDIAEKLRAIGRVVNPAGTAALYAPLHEKQPYSGIKLTRDVKYGPADRNLADIFVPEGPSTGPRPVLIFVHGGGFTRGDRQSPPGTPFNDNIAVWAARNGFIGVNITYRLAPQFGWPTGAEDTGLAVRWVGENIATYGGDPSRVFLSGHSAGAAHVASYIGHPEFWGPRGIGLAGGIILSGLFDFTTMTAGEPEKAYLGTDPSKYAERSSLVGLTKVNIPLFIAYAELDPPFFVQQGDQLVAALRKAGKSPVFLPLKGHSHMSEVFAINTKDTELSGAMAKFIKGGT